MGLVVSAYGPLLEHLTRRFSISLPVAGAVISIHFAGGLIGVLVGMRAMQVLPARRTVMVSTAAVGAGCAGLALAPSWPAFMTAVFVVGLGFGGLDIALNQVVAYSEGPRRAALLNGLNGLYSGGAVAGPLLVAAFAASHFTLLYFAGAVVAVGLIPADRGISGRLPVPAESRSRSSPLIVMFILAIVLYVGLENGIGGWMTSHLESTGLSSGTAVTFTSGFWLALMTGRLLMTLVPAHISEPTIVLAGSVIATVALIATSFGAVAPWTYVVCGLAVAPIFPTSVVWLARLYPGDARATSWLFPATAVGGIAGPGAIGLVIAGFGISWAPAVLAVAAVAMTAAFWMAARYARTAAA